MSGQNSQWTTQALTRTYLEGVRGAIPLAEAQIEVVLKIVAAWCRGVQERIRVLDLGCGDGILGRAVLDRYPGAHVVFVGFSAPMLDAARAELGADSAAQLVQADFSSPDWLGHLDGTGFDVVLSGFSIHHQSDERKRTLYAEVYDLLAPAGFSWTWSTLARLRQRLRHCSTSTFDHLYDYHRRSDPGVTRQEVAETYYNRPDKAENVLAFVETQCRWLRQIGFKDVDCFLKVFELALFGGRKPAVWEPSAAGPGGLRNTAPYHAVEWANPSPQGGGCRDQFSVPSGMRAVRSRAGSRPAVESMSPVSKAVAGPL